MLAEHIDEALRRARYEPIQDEETPYYGEVPELPGVWVCVRTLEGCRRELKDVGVRRSLEIPALDGVEIPETGTRAA